MYPSEMLRRSVAVSAALITLVAAIMVLSTTGANGENTSVQLVARNPIMIDSDEKFTTQNGVVSGSGTKSDPYIIEGWEIGNSGNVTAIDIHNTRVDFRIRNVHIYSCNVGILMSNVHDGRVESSQFENCSIGVAIVRSDDCKVTTSSFYGSDIAISISYSDVSQSDNTFTNCVEDVIRLKKEVPWIQTWKGTALCVAVLIPLVLVISFLLYFRFKRGPPIKF